MLAAELIDKLLADIDQLMTILDATRARMRHAEADCAEARARLKAATDALNQARDQAAEDTEQTHTTTVTTIDDDIFGPNALATWACTCGDSSDGTLAIPVATRQAAAHEDHTTGGNRG
jgi:hypothetical protein